MTGARILGPVLRFCPAPFSIHGEDELPGSGLMSSENVWRNRILRQDPVPLAPGKLIYSGYPFRVFEQSAGMGENEFAVFRQDSFLCRTADSRIAFEIIHALRRGSL